MVLATAVDINLILQIIILILGLLGAYLAKRGLIDRKDLEDTKHIASSLAGSVDKLKQMDPNAAEVLIREIISRIGEKKPVLDAFLKAMNHNQPNGKDGS